MKYPLYYNKYYSKFYDNENVLRFFNHQYVVFFFGLFGKKNIEESALRSIKRTDKVLMLGVSFGDFIEKIAKKAKSIDVVDISKTQIEFNEDKFFDMYKNIKFIHQNAAAEVDGKYDVVICNNILHEVPIVSKSKIVNNALAVTKKTGQTIFVDYHKPNKYFIFSYFIRMFNRLYQPFAEKIWDKSIETYAKEKHKYTWRKSTYFFGCFQKVVVKSRADI